MSPYPEIQALQNLLNSHKILIEALKDGAFFASNHVWVRLQINRQTFTLLVDDEYKDFQISNQALHLCLILRELEMYEEEADVLTWTRAKGLDPGIPEILSYYRELQTIYLSVEKELGRIDAQISDLDFQLNAGAAQALRNGSSETF